MTHMVFDVVKNHFVFEMCIVRPICLVKRHCVTMGDIPVMTKEPRVITIKRDQNISETLIVHNGLSVPLLPLKELGGEATMRTLFSSIRYGVSAFGTLYQGHNFPPQFASLRFSMKPSFLSLARIPPSERFSVTAISEMGTFF